MAAAMSACVIPPPQRPSKATNRVAPTSRVVSERAASRSERRETRTVRRHGPAECQLPSGHHSAHRATHSIWGVGQAEAGTDGGGSGAAESNGASWQVPPSAPPSPPPEVARHRSSIRRISMKIKRDNTAISRDMLDKGHVWNMKFYYLFPLLVHLRNLDFLSRWLFPILYMSFLVVMGIQVNFGSDHLQMLSNAPGDCR